MFNTSQRKIVSKKLREKFGFKGFNHWTENKKKFCICFPLTKFFFFPFSNRYSFFTQKEYNYFLFSFQKTDNQLFNFQTNELVGRFFLSILSYLYIFLTL